MIPKLPPHLVERKEAIRRALQEIGGILERLEAGHGTDAAQSVLRSLGVAQ